MQSSTSTGFIPDNLSVITSLNNKWVKILSKVKTYLYVQYTFVISGKLQNQVNFLKSICTIMHRNGAQSNTAFSHVVGSVDYRL